MAPSLSVPPLSLLHFWLFLSARALEMIDGDAPELTCSEGLTDCDVKSLFDYSPPDPDDTTSITHVQLQVCLCCSAAQDCKPCLQVNITVQGKFVMSSVKVCHISPGSHEFCKMLEFKPKNLGFDQSQHHTLQVMSESRTILKTVNILTESLISVLNVIDDVSVSVPRLRAVTDHKRKEVLLQLENNTNTSQDKLMLRMVWNNISGEALTWPKGKTEMAVSSDVVAPCLCFEVWWKGKELRRQFCPFKNKQDALERMQQNVSIAVVESWMRDGTPRLRWNVTAPCRLEGEVWLCKKDQAGSLCKEVVGSKQRLNNHEHAGWRASRKVHWQTGEFNTSSHPLLCIQLQIDGMKWSLPFLIPSLLICISILGVYFIQGVLKGYMWRWLKEDDVKGAVGGGHVVLLYPSDDDQALPELMSHLGSSLQALGFSVSWTCGARLSWVGPGPHPDCLDQSCRMGCWERFTASLSCILADYLQGRAGERFMLVQFESLPPEPPGGFRPLPELFRGLHVYSLPSQSLGFLTELAGARQMATASARRKRAGGLRLASRALARGLSGFTAGTTVLRLAGVSQGCVGVEFEDSMETVPLKPCLVNSSLQP
uniref:Interleukin-17 receptor C/E N-terminal domain-containing protein n=1 Tax=Labrus bergylta TaxID=56723 RepID=A0A3Q3EJJ1_9LABR